MSVKWNKVVVTKMDVSYDYWKKEYQYTKDADHPYKVYPAGVTNLNAGAYYICATKSGNGGSVVSFEFMENGDACHSNSAHYVSKRFKKAIEEVSDDFNFVR